MTSRALATENGTARLIANNCGNSEAGAGQTQLTVASVRESLMRQEDSIIFSLIERAQYPCNRSAYDGTLFPIPGFESSLFEYLLRETESVHAKAGRYASPDEHRFFHSRWQPEPLLQGWQLHPKVLHKAPDQININPWIWKMYFADLLPKLTADGDDGNYGSAATCDILCLQALSKRIHYGMFVAEARFTESPQVFEPHIRSKDVHALYKLITFESIEHNMRRRVENKAIAYGQEVAVNGLTEPQLLKINSELVGRLYSEWIMPLNKTVQIEYLLHWLD